jgi:hypothetical protein
LTTGRNADAEVTFSGILTFRHLHIIFPASFSKSKTCISFHYLQYGCIGCVPFCIQQYGRPGCIPFYHHQYGRAGLSLSTTSSIYLQGASLSTASSMDVKGVSTSIASSMDIQGVSHSTSSMANQDVSLSAANSMGVQDVSLSTTSSMDMQGVCIFFHLNKVFFKCPNAVLTGIFSVRYQRTNMLMPEPVMLRYQTEMPHAGMLMLKASASMLMSSYE